MAAFERADVDWAGAVRSNPVFRKDVLGRLRALKDYARVGKSKAVTGLNPDLRTVNAVSSILLPNIALAGSPVLLPLDLSKLSAEILKSGKFVNAGRTSSYLGQLSEPRFFPGPYGYRAFFRLKSSSTVLITGSSIFYRLQTTFDPPRLDSCSSIAGMARAPIGGDTEAADQGFYDYLTSYGKRIGAAESGYFSSGEAAIPCLFAGALVEIHILCDGIGDPDCRVKDVARSILGTLGFVGGAPRPGRNPAVNDPIRDLERVLGPPDAGVSAARRATASGYRLPGDLLPGSGVNAAGGSRDFNLYGSILFPTDLETTAQTIMFRVDQKCDEDRDIDAGATCTHKGIVVRKAPFGEWRDNFCEDRDANRLLTCPSGRGHAGQDIGGNWATIPGKHVLRAVVDGVAFRRFPAQAAVTIADVNGTNIDYLYRHMKPSDLTGHGIQPSNPRYVAKGCVLAFVGGFDTVSRENTGLSDGSIHYDPTPRHLHFEIRVPTRFGFENVSPYWTLVHAHRLLSADAGSVSSADQPCGPGLTRSGSN